MYSRYNRGWNCCHSKYDTQGIENVCNDVGTTAEYSNMTNNCCCEYDNHDNSNCGCGCNNNCGCGCGC